MNEERISKRQLTRLFDVDNATIENWIKHRGFPMIIVSTHNKYVLRKDLEIWEQKMKLNSDK